MKNIPFHKVFVIYHLSNFTQKATVNKKPYACAISLTEITIFVPNHELIMNVA